MLFTHNGKQLDSKFMTFPTPEQKAYVRLLEETILTLEFKLREQVREMREKILEDKL